jgi:hypothetical protein
MIIVQLLRPAHRADHDNTRSIKKIVKRMGKRIKLLMIFGLFLPMSQEEIALRERSK